MSKPIALITGITGQDGSYLAAYLLGKNYEVHGITSSREEIPWRHTYLDIHTKVTLHAVNLTNQNAVADMLREITPIEVYHLAAQSSVAAARLNPYPTLEFNILSTAALLEAIMTVDPTIRVFNASSSEIFDQSTSTPLTLHSPLRPSTTYGISKLAGQLLVQEYRTNRGLFAVSGILFPHESPLRQPTSFLKTLIRDAIACKDGTAEHIPVGTITTERDFGDARVYVEMMWKSLQVQDAHDYIIATGIPTKLSDLVDYVINKLGLPPSVVQAVSSTTNQYPARIYGDPNETIEKLAVPTKGDIFATIDAMIEFETIRTTSGTL